MGDHTRVAEWLRVPHRLSVTISLSPKLSVFAISQLLRNCLCTSRGYLHNPSGPSDQDVNEIAEALTASGWCCGADVAALTRAATVSAVRRVACLAASDDKAVEIAVETQDLREAVGLSTWSRQRRVENACFRMCLQRGRTRQD